LEARLRRVTSRLPLSVEEENPPDRLRARILAAAGAPATAAPSRRPVLHLPRLGRPRLRLTLRSAVAVLAAAVVALVGWNAYLTRQLAGARSAVASYQLAVASPALAASHGQVVALRNQGLLLVDFKDMPQPEAGKVYELWLGTGSGTMVPAGVFRPDGDGSKLVLLSQDISRYSVLALTVEQGPDGTQAPTEAPGMSGSI
jgi:anti-sigma-K factor RskA